MAMVPHERSLVKRFEGKPFALLGIDLDDSKEILKRTEKDQQITWRSWWDGRSGPIARQWGIQFLPTTYVLDQKGVIRHVNLQGAALDQAVDGLLKELEKEDKPRS